MSVVDLDIGVWNACCAVGLVFGGEVERGPAFERTEERVLRTSSIACQRRTRFKSHRGGGQRGHHGSVKK